MLFMAGVSSEALSRPTGHVTRSAPIATVALLGEPSRKTPLVPSLESPFFAAPGSPPTDSLSKAKGPLLFWTPGVGGRVNPAAKEEITMYYIRESDAVEGIENALSDLDRLPLALREKIALNQAFRQFLATGNTPIVKENLATAFSELAGSGYWAKQLLPVWSLLSAPDPLKKGIRLDLGPNGSFVLKASYLTAQKNRLAELRETLSHAARTGMNPGRPLSVDFQKSEAGSDELVLFLGEEPIVRLQVDYRSTSPKYAAKAENFTHGLELAQEFKLFVPPEKFDAFTLTTSMTADHAREKFEALPRLVRLSIWLQLFRNFVILQADPALPETAAALQAIQTWEERTEKEPGFWVKDPEALERDWKALEEATEKALRSL